MRCSRPTRIRANRARWRALVRLALVPLTLVLTSGCAGGSVGDETPAPSATTGGDAARVAAPRATPSPRPVLTDVPAPVVGEGPLAPAVVEDLDRLFASLAGSPDLAAVERLGRAGDARVAWPLADLFRYYPLGDPFAETVREALAVLTGVEFPWQYWVTATDQLIAWDLPAPPGYVAWKRIPLERFEPAWKPFFDDEDALFDYRFLGWGGVYIDDRSLVNARAGDYCPGGCIPALDFPAVTDARGGSWYADDRIVFGVVVAGEARAYPKHIMEVHEMVNDTLGGREIGMPYCTLCGSAQAYFTDRPPAGYEHERLELRTSGLLSRSNKVMFDLHTYSAFDTFTGRAVSGPLREAGFVLDPISVVVSTWGEWKAAYPGTSIVAEDGGIGRSYRDDPLRGRDDGGPIFPIGDVDPRLPVQEPVLGVERDGGPPLAFPVVAARAALMDGRPVALDGVVVEADAGGLSARTADGRPLVVHQAFWFAWSQFRPDTLLWE